MIGIYKITSPTGKVYVGQSINIKKRFEAYRRAECINQTKLYNSIVKYGFSEHIFEIVEECKVEELNTRERYWQDFYDVLSISGLNCRLTGIDDRSGRLSPETGRKIGDAHKKEVLQYSIEGVFIREWNSITEAGEVLGLQRGNIPACCRGIRKSVGGFLWRYKIGAIEQIVQVEKAKDRIWPGRGKRSILQFSREKVYIKKWNSIKEAAEALKIRETSIVNCCKKRTRTSGGFIWKYK